MRPAARTAARCSSGTARATKLSDRHAEARSDLDEPGALHEQPGVAAQQLRGEWGRVLVPVHEHARELVEARHDGSHDEREAEDLVGLPGRG